MALYTRVLNYSTEESIGYPDLLRNDREPIFLLYEFLKAGHTAVNTGLSIDQ